MQKRSISVPECLLAAGSTAVIAVLEYLTTHRLDFAAFFLVPIIALAWRQGRRAGIVLAVVTAVAWGTVDRLSVPADWPTGLVVANALIRLAVNLFAVHIVARLRDRRDEALRMASSDGLTGVANSRSFRETATRAVKKAREEKTPLTVAFMDLDDFKKVNDTLGHAVGDEVLQLVAQTLQRNVRGTDLVARLGGDEFAVLLPGTDLEAAQALFERLQKELKGLFNRRGLPVGASVGVAAFAVPPLEVEELLRHADELMYEVKRSGKGAFAAKRWQDGQASG